MNPKKQIGLVAFVIAAIASVWSFARFTSLEGKLCSWSTPFCEYEVNTLIGVGIAGVLVLVGLKLIYSKDSAETKTGVTPNESLKE